MKQRIKKFFKKKKKSKPSHTSFNSSQDKKKNISNIKNPCSRVNSFRVGYWKCSVTLKRKKNIMLDKSRNATLIII